jgi:hypothetical protein
VSCPAPASLAPGAFITCTASYTITQGDLDAGSVTNIASATNGEVTSLPDTETAKGEKKPGLTIDKTITAGNPYALVGDVISYSYLVTNSGNVTLSEPFTVTDDKTMVGCRETGSLAPGAFITCTASYTITQEDLAKGSVTNIASATNGPVTSPPDTETAEAAQSPALTIDKTITAGNPYAKAGAIINYRYLVTNIGNVTLSEPFTVTDDKTTVSCPETESLAPGASMTCMASYTITEEDWEKGSVINIASATSGSVTSPTVTATATRAFSE